MAIVTKESMKKFVVDLMDVERAIVGVILRHHLKEDAAEYLLSEIDRTSSEKHTCEKIHNLIQMDSSGLGRIN